MTKIFYLEPTKLSKLYLRRHATGPCPAHPGEYSYHNAKVDIGIGPASGVSGDVHPHADPRWPRMCECGYAFTNDDAYQLHSEQLYARTDTLESMTLKEAPIGACWNAWWMARRKVYPNFGIGEDGRCLMIKTPGGEWCPDQRASNCTMPDDTKHKCWVRHGSPEGGDFHIDKNGITCAAGAGSISLPTYHGFCHHGHLTEC